MPQGSSNFVLNQLISLIIPAYNQGGTIVDDVKNIESSLQALHCHYEIIVVNDGSKDDTYKKALKIKSPHVTVLSYDKNHGKGHAIRYGMMQANGDIIGFIDAGMDIDPKGFAMLLNHMDWYNADVIVGSKLHPVSKVHYPFWRKVLSWGYRFVTRKMFGFKIRDTQVGLKFFRRAVVKDVLPRLLVKKYAFDIEMLAVSYRLGYKRIYEAPIDITFTSNSITKLNLWKVISGMLWDTAAVYYRLKILHYYDNHKFKKIDAKELSMQPLYKR